jgi:prepilin-type processing-associated H-X9-DG protein
VADERDGIDKVADIIKDIRTCMLTTVSDDGRLLSRPMAVQQVRFGGDLWFVADGGSGKIGHIRHSTQVNVAFVDGDTWVSLAGTAEVIHDDAKAEELWNSNLDTWFPRGPRTPGLVLIKVQADTAEYWDASFANPVGAVSSLIKLATGRAKGRRPDIAENETVQLGTDTSSSDR